MNTTVHPLQREENTQTRRETKTSVINAQQNAQTAANTSVVSQYSDVVLTGEVRLHFQ